MRFHAIQVGRIAVGRTTMLLPMVILCPLLMSAADQPWTWHQLCAAKEGPRMVQITPPGSLDQTTCKDTEGVTAFRFPEDGPGYPGYGNFYAGFFPNDGTWAGLTFFADPACVRPDFNLLDWIDIPAVLNCRMNIAGVNFSTPTARFFEIKITLPAGAATPVYFVLWQELQAAIADGVLTIGELQSLPSLRIGIADKLEYHALNSNAPCGDGIGHEYFKASGYLQDGRKFHFNYEEMFLPSPNLHLFPKMKIEFTPPAD